MAWPPGAQRDAAAVAAAGAATGHGRQARPPHPRHRICGAGPADAEPGAAVRREPRRNRPRCSLACRVAPGAAVRAAGIVAFPQQPAVAGGQPGDARGQRHRIRVRRDAEATQGASGMKVVLGNYLRRRVAGQIFGLLLALTALMQLLELLEVTTDVLDRGLGAGGIIRYAVLRMPAQLEIALPLAGLLGSMAAFYALARTREITAMRSAGVGLGRVMLYLLPVPLLFALLSVALAQKLVPMAEGSLKSWWDAAVPLESQPADPEWVGT